MNADLWYMYSEIGWTGPGEPLEDCDISTMAWRLEAGSEMCSRYRRVTLTCDTLSPCRNHLFIVY